MKLDLPRFFKACNPNKTLAVGNEEDRQYYIDFSTVRGGNIVRDLGRTIARLSPDEPTCQLFTGHIGCGKSTELLCLQADLESKGFHVVYFQSSQDLDMADVDITDIFMAIAHQVNRSLESIQIKVKPSYFTNLFREIIDILQTPVDISEVGFSTGIATLTARTKDSPRLRSQLRQYLEPRANGILDAINRELLEPANQVLQARGQQGLVVLVDNLDRVDNLLKPNGRTQPEYLFVDRGEQLKRLQCHIVYTIPLSLVFSNDLGRMSLRFGLKPKVLPMVPVQTRQHKDFEPGITQLREMVMARAFPQADVKQRQTLVTAVFDQSETLNRLCRVSGGHVRNLLRLLYGCLQREDPPIQRAVLEEVIREDRDELMGPIAEEEWELLLQAAQRQSISGDQDYQTLLQSLLLFEYRDQNGRWFGINPILAESERFKAWQQGER